MNNDCIASKREKKRKKLADFARSLPNCPGVYMMRMENDFLLYIGKASSLQKRVGSYFLSSADLGPWKQGMLQEIDHIETIKCETEWEALLLEARLIKDHRPKYNTLQLDGKTYPDWKLIAEPTLTTSPVTEPSLFFDNISFEFLSAYSPMKEKPLYLK